MMTLVLFLFRSLALGPILGADSDSTPHSKSPPLRLSLRGLVGIHRFLQPHTGDANNGPHSCCMNLTLRRLALPHCLAETMPPAPSQSCSSGMPFCVRLDLTKYFKEVLLLEFSNVMITLPQVRRSFINKIHKYCE